MKFNTNGISSTTVAVTDYAVVNPTLAKVVLAFTGTNDAEVIASKLGEKLQQLAAPVEKSFRIVKEGVAVGFVRANRAVRMVTDEEVNASYVKIGASSNVLMDKNDSSLWEIRKGASGKYLARHGNEDLSELVNAAVTQRSDLPKLHNITMASIKPNEFVAFASASGDMDYGFCVATKDDKLKVVSSTTKSAVVVDKALVASAVDVKLPKEAHTRITAAGIDRASINNAVEYYTRLYSYDPSYMEEVIKQVENMAAL